MEVKYVRGNPKLGDGLVQILLERILEKFPTDKQSSQNSLVGWITRLSKASYPRSQGVQEAINNGELIQAELAVLEFAEKYPSDRKVTGLRDDSKTPDKRTTTGKGLFAGMKAGGLDPEADAPYPVS